MTDKFDFTKPFQRKILHLFLIDSDFTNKYAEMVIPDYFEESGVGTIFTIFKAYFEKFSTLPSSQTLSEEIAHHESRSLISPEEASIARAKLKKIFETKLTDTPYVEDRVIHFAKNQAMKNFVLESADLVLKGEFDEVYKKLEKAMSVGNKLLNIGMDYFLQEEIERRIAERVEGMRKDAITTGIEKLDEYLLGGMCPEETGVVLAPTGRGKSIFLIHLGKIAVKAGKNVFFYTLELSEKRIGNRFDSSICGVTYHKLHSFPNRVKKRLLRIWKQVHSHLFIKYLPYEESTVLDIKAHLKNIYSIKGIKPDLILIDYGDIMKPYHYSFKEKRHEQANIFSEICGLAIEEKTRIFTASQTNRASLSRDTITLSDISESYAKVMRCDVVLGLCQTEEEAIDKKGRIFMAKVRDAEDRKMIPIEFYKEKMLITYDKERDEENDGIHHGNGKGDDD